MNRLGSLHIVVLAAGAATRFGKPKQLAVLDGRPLLMHVLGRALEVAGSAVSVVIGAHATAIAPVLNRCNASIIVNRNWEEGIASSIRLAVQRLSGACDGAMLVLADQLGVTAADLQHLADLWHRQPNSIVAARYGGALGVPAIFPRALFGELLELRGDRGAQALLRRHESRLVALQMPAAAVDVDTPEDLKRLIGERQTPAAGLH
jgi:CTP:molybdopterin cytidylyltransferase MocA